MPSDIHNSDQIWFYRCLYQWSTAGLLREKEVDALYPTSNTCAVFLFSLFPLVLDFFLPYGYTDFRSIAYVFSEGPLVGEEKLPDLSIEVTNNPMPLVIFESGWSESFNQLREDMM